MGLMAPARLMLRKRAPRGASAAVRKRHRCRPVPAVFTALVGQRVGFLSQVASSIPVLIDSQAQFIDYMVAETSIRIPDYQAAARDCRPGACMVLRTSKPMPAFEDILLCPSTSATQE
jgi:hypothetical protein